MDELLKFADMALYESKSEGSNTYNFYNAELDSSMRRKAEIIFNLKKAIENNEIYLEYQPQFNIKQNKITGVEALMRWKNKKLGYIPPSDFIPVAEETGYIIELGKWLIENAFNMCCKLNKNGNPLAMSLNISSIQLEDRNLLDFIRHNLKKYEIPPSLIKFEVTESQVIVPNKRNIKILNEIASLGIGIIIDDFGTGYSSISYIARFPIEEIKIDKLFIHMLEKNKKIEAVIDIIIKMSKCLGISVTAEGIETKSQFEKLKEMSCDTIQGFYIGKPMAADDIISKVL